MIRQFLWLAVVVGAMALPVRAETPTSQGAEKLGWKLTLQSWTVNSKTVSESIDVAKELGIHYLEVFPGQKIFPATAGKDGEGAKPQGNKFGMDMTDAEIEAILAKAKSADVKIIDFGVTGISKNEAEARKIFDWAKKVGITTLVSEPEPEALPMIDKVAGEYGINVALHDHPKPSRYWDPEFTFNNIKDLKHIGFCADVGHWKRSGLVPVDVLKKYGDRVFSSHFKDLIPNENGKGWHDVPWGTGQSQAAEMLATLKEKGFKGPIAIEYEYKWDIPTLQRNVDFFNEQANKLAAQ